MQIGEVAKRVGVKASAIRYYESTGLIPKVSRTSGQRQYSEDILTHLKVIQVAKRMGFSIKELQTLLRGFDPSVKDTKKWQLMAGQKLQELKNIAEDAKEMQKLIREALECGCVDLKNCRFLRNR